MNVVSIAELIMLQTIEDLWNEEERGDSINFFRGKDFTVCAEIAGMGLYDQARLLGMVQVIVNQTNRVRMKTGHIRKNALV